MKKIFKYAAIAAAVAICLGAGNAFAKDAIKATVNANGFTFTENGTPLSPGTYAVGTLKIYMIVSATQWPADLGDVELDLAVQQGPTTGQQTNYGNLQILLRQAGKGLVLTPDPSTFNVTGSSWTGQSTIRVTVPQAIIDDPTFNEDGTMLVGNLQIEPMSVGSKLDTVTTVKIYATLVYPDELACLRTVAFITNNGLETNLTESTTKLELRYEWKRVPAGPTGTLTCLYKDYNPTQTLYDILVVNSCAETKEFDLDVVVDSAFSVPTSGNPVKAYVATNAAANEEALIDSFAELTLAFPSGFGSATNQGTNLCLPNLPLGGMKTLYARVDIGLNESGFTICSTMPAVGTEYDRFTSDVLSIIGTPSNCTGDYHPEWEDSGDTLVGIRTRSCSGNSTECALAFP